MNSSSEGFSTTCMIQMSSHEFKYPTALLREISCGSKRMERLIRISTKAYVAVDSIAYLNLGYIVCLVSRYSKNALKTLQLLPKPNSHVQPSRITVTTRLRAINALISIPTSRYLATQMPVLWHDLCTVKHVCSCCHL